MSEPEAEIEIPQQPAGERTKHILFWVAFTVLSIATMLIDSPYSLRDQSTIMVKGEIVSGIRSARKTYQGWPVNDEDLRFGFGTLATKESSKPKFRLVNLTYDINDPAIEFAHYAFAFRDAKQTIVIRFNPKEEAKRKLF